MKARMLLALAFAFAVILIMGLAIACAIIYPLSWLIVGPLLVGFFIGLAGHLIPLGIAWVRLRRLKNSSIQMVREEWLYDLLTLYGMLKGRKDKWRFARQPYGHLVFNLAEELFFQVPDNVAGNHQYRDWFGEHTYELFHVLGDDGEWERRWAEKLDRMIAANIQDYETFYGYCETAGVEAALVAFELDIPIEYARSML